VLRLDVGLPPKRDLLNMADLDNYAYPLAYRLKDPALVSVWCTKRHNEQSFVRIEPAEEVFPPSMGWLVATTSASASTVAYKEQIHAAVAGAAELPAGPVRLELSFVVGPRRNWLNLWKQTIDSLDPILGRTYPNRDWNPLDGRITELGLHLTVDPAAGNAIKVGVAAGQAPDDVAVRYIDMLDRVLIDQPGTRDHCRVATVMSVGPGEQATLEIGRLWFGISTSKLSVIDKRIPEGTVITHLIGHDGPCRDTEGTPGRCDIILAQGYSTPDDDELRSFRCGQPCKARTDVIPQHRPNDPAVVHNSTPDATLSPVDQPIDEELLRANEIGVQGPEAVVFRDDDAGYRNWLSAHANGYVINIARSHSVTASRLHHADCRTINGQNPHQGAWTGPYVKVCAEHLADLEQWATDNVHEPIAPCGTCNPHHQRS
jgi:hypothetical protein